MPHIAACVDNSLAFHQQLFGWKPSEKVTVFLQDWQDTGYGAANTVPRNWINLGLSPMNYTYETVPAIDRYYWLANHEVAHLATMDQAAGSDLSWRKFFAGKVTPNSEDPISIFYNYLTNPRWNSPRWYHEGIAVFLETWMDGGMGRALGAYDEMVFRSMVLDDAYFYDVVGLESEGTTVDFQTGVNSYLYGTRFMSYLAYTYGPEKLIEWTARRPESKAHFASQFKNVYGVPMAEEWQRWIEFEHEWQSTNLDSIRENPTTVYRDLSPTALGSVSRAYHRPRARQGVPRRPLPGPDRAPGGARPRDRRAREDHRAQGTRGLLRHLARVRSRHPHLLLHLRQLGVARPLDASTSTPARRSGSRTTSGSATWPSTAAIDRCGESSAWTDAPS